MLKILYAGSPDAAAATLKLLIDFSKDPNAGYTIAGVLTNPPSAQGRHKELISTPVESVAREQNIPVFTPEHLDAECRAQIEVHGFDMLVCFAYGHIFGPKFLAMFRHGGINLHPSLLPLYRGCTPVNAAILNMDSRTAFTVQTLAQGMDEGNILAQKIVELTGTETAESLLNAAAADGAYLIKDVLKETDSTGSRPEGVPQNGEASYTQIIRREDALIDWNRSSEELDAQVRGYFPEPGAYTYISENETLKILEARAMKEEEIAEIAALVPDLEKSEAGKVLLFSKKFGILIKCGKGILAVRLLQRQQKKAMAYKDFMNGARDFTGSVLGLKA